MPYNFVPHSFHTGVTAEALQAKIDRKSAISHQRGHSNPGASTQGGNGAKCTMAKIGGECCDDNDAFGRVYNNLLLHEYIYYFTPVHFQLNCCLPFFYTVSQKTSPMFLAITRESIVGF